MNPADTPAQPAPPPPDQDLDAGLRNRPPSDVPVITPTTEDQGPIITPAPERRSAPEIN